MLEEFRWSIENGKRDQKEYRSYRPYERELLWLQGENWEEDEADGIACVTSQYAHYEQ